MDDQPDKCPIEWIISLRQWANQYGAGGLKRIHTVAWATYEELLGVAAGKVVRWWNVEFNETTQDSEQLTKIEFLRLCPLLHAWHAYEPPTDEWRGLMIRN